MSENFTPGPWEVQYEQLSPRSEKRGFTIVTEAFDVVSGLLAIRREADAQLIAAAPDMYAALNRMCHNALDIGHCHMADCHNCQTMAVLKKARGKQ